MNYLNRGIKIILYTAVIAGIILSILIITGVMPCAGQ